jgi:transcription initiation factor TFIIB
MNAYTTLNTELGLPAQPVTPSAFVPRLASELDVSDRIRQRARELAEHAAAAGVTTGVQPSGFAAASLYKVGQEHGLLLTQSTIADVANSSPVTLRTHRNTLDELLEQTDQSSSPSAGEGNQSLSTQRGAQSTD